MRYYALVVAAILLIGLAILPVSAGNGTVTINERGTIPLNVFFNEIAENALYTGEGNAIRVYDITPGIDLTKVKDYTYEYRLPDETRGFYRDGNYLYALSTGTLEVFDITNQTYPTHLSTRTQSGVEYHNIAVYGNYAYIGGANTIYVYDVTDKNAPSLVRGISEWSVPYASSKKVWSLCTDANYLYVAYGDPKAFGGLGFEIFSIADGSNPISVNRTLYGGTGQGSTTGIAVKGDTLYISQYSSAIRAFNITNRSAPSAIWTSYSDTNNSASVDLAIYGNYLFSSNRYKVYTDGGGFTVFNIASPVPYLVSQSVYPTYYTEQISTNGNVTAVSTNAVGTNIYDTTSKSNPVYKSKIRTASSPWSFTTTIIGDKKFLVSGGRDVGIFLWDITDPEVLAAHVKTETMWYPYNTSYMPRTTSLAFIDNLSYSNQDGNGGGAFVVNWTDYENQDIPPFVLFGTSSNNFFSFSIPNKTNDRMYVEGYYGFEIWDLSNRWNPSMISRGAGSLPATGVAWNDTIQIGPYYDNGIKVTSTKNATSPTFLALYDSITPNDVYTHHVYAGMAMNTTTKIIYAVYRVGPGYSYEVVQIDASNPLALHKEPGYGTLSFSGTFSADSLILNGTDILIASTSTGYVRQYDVSNPYNMRYIDQAYVIGGKIYAMTFRDGYLYAGGESTIEIYNIKPSPAVIPAYPMVKWTADKFTGKAPLTVHFTDQSDTTTTYRNWSFDDGTFVENIINPTHTYNNTGEYHVSLLISNASGPNTSATQTITVHNVGSDFYANRTWNSTGPFPVCFTSLEQNGVSYKWFFNHVNGNETPDSTNRNETWIFPASGTYTVNYTVTDGTYSESKTRYITIATPGTTYQELNLLPSEDGYVGRTTSGSTITSIATGVGTLVDRSSTSMTTQITTGSPSSVFTNNEFSVLSFNLSELLPEYTISSVKLTMYSLYVGTSYAAGSLYVTPIDLISNTQMRAADYQNTSLTLLSDAQYVEPIQPGSHTWTFTTAGKNYITARNQSFAAIAVRSENDITRTEMAHPYANYYYVSQFSTREASSNKPNLKINISFFNVPQNPPKPSADFIKYPNNYGIAPFSVQFYDASTNNPTSWLWDLGDGNSSTEMNPTHTYNTVGEYTVSLISANAAGNSSASKTVIVQTASQEPIVPVTDFICYPVFGNGTLFTTCTDQSTNTPTSWSWAYKNATVGWTLIGTDQNPSISLPTGVYDINLTATNAAGSDDEIKTEYITVTAGETAPVASFTKSKTLVVFPSIVTFTDTSTNTPTSWEWMMGDGRANVTTQNITYQYLRRGLFKVDLAATNAGGTGVATSQYVWVTGFPKMTFPYNSLMVSVEDGTFTSSRPLTEKETMKVRCQMYGYGKECYEGK